MKHRWLHGLEALMLPLLTACGTAAVAQIEPPTPTPLAPDPGIERPTYAVKRGVIERVLEVNGRVTPIDLVRLSFKRSGRIAQVAIDRGDTVKTGMVLAELQQDDERDALRTAEGTLLQAQRDLQTAQQQQQIAIKEAETALQQAQQDLQLVQPGGAEDPIPDAQQALAEAQRDAQEVNYSGSEAKTNAEQAVLKAVQALQDAQQAYSVAFWNNDWVTSGT